MTSSRPRRGERRALWLALLLCLAGCVQPFGGSWIALSLIWPPTQPAPLPMGDHLEMWAQFGSGKDTHFLRLVTNETGTFFGFDLQPALNPNDPCLIRAFDRDDDACVAANADPSQCGAHLLSADGQAGFPSTTGDPKLEQLAVVEHVRQVVPKTTSIVAAGGVAGLAPVPLLVLVDYEPAAASEPVLMLTEANAGNGAAAATRFDKCRAFLGSPLDPPDQQAHANYYLGNPRQFTKPLHGVLYGFFDFCTMPQWPASVPLPPGCALAPTLPSQNFGSITVVTPQSLDSLTGLLITREASAMPFGPSQDPTRLVVAGQVLPDVAGGRGVIRLALVITVPTMMGPQIVPVGTASVMTDLTQGLPN